ncbi:Dnase family scn1 [Favolaschia claudopus]|uniref:Dnase family scn1 n=1 Tax=Favolaschia claudopus TaxID=2862362 RepID=A0AAW0EHE1_9AGAR
MAVFPPNVLCHIVDAHCHPTDSKIPVDSVERLDIKICAMSTHRGDQSLVRDLALKNPAKVIPCFGYHPWFSHQISLHPGTSKTDHYRGLFLGDGSQENAENTAIFDELLRLLPEPMDLDDVILELRQNFQLFSSSTALLGEVGLDKAFRVAFDYYASPRRLTPFTIPIDHQISILERQIDLAVELKRNVSLHSVKCPQATVDLLNNLKKRHGPQWDSIRVDLHSCSMNPQVVVDLQKKHSNMFMSLSTTINGRSNNLNALIAECSPDRLLVESDYNHIDHCTDKCIEIVKLVAQVKQWPIEEEWIDGTLPEDQWGAIRRLEANWKSFIAAESK